MVLAKLKPRSLLSRRRADCTKYTYDDEGNLTGKTSVASPTVTWAYTWDVNNRMVAAVKSAGSNLYTVDYKYDVFGNRIEQVEDVDGAGATASVTTRFAWEGAKVMQDAWQRRTTPVGTENWNIWADVDGSNGLKVRYVRGDEVDQLFSRVKVDGSVASYLTDRMGSVRQMLDASGVISNTITYDGFGNVTAETDAAFGDRWKWTGRESNGYTGLQYNRARYYSGESGRWISEDPLGFPSGDYNLQRYVNNTTINAVDPNGFEIIWLHKNRGTSAHGTGPGSPTGHSAILIGNANDGWYYYSWEGSGMETDYYPTWGDILKEHQEPGSVMNDYDKWVVIDPTNDNDEAAGKRAAEIIESGEPYTWTDFNCCLVAAIIGGVEKVRMANTGSPTGFSWPSPTHTFDDLKQKYPRSGSFPPVKDDPGGKGEYQPGSWFY
jgi:RHS repeat-associated protein